MLATVCLWVLLIPTLVVGATIIVAFGFLIDYIIIVPAVQLAIKLGPTRAKVWGLILVSLGFALDFFAS